MFTLLCLSDVRKCPRCSVFVTKDDGCLHVSCPRCQLAFCWSCMGPLSGHSKCHRLCPELPWSMLANICVTFGFLCSLPVWTVLGPLLYALFMALCYGVPVIWRHFSITKKCRCFSAFLVTLLLTIIAVVPGALIGGSLASVIITVIGILPLIFWSLSYLIRVCYHYNRLIWCP